MAHISLSIWSKKGLGGIDERCRLNLDGDYVGIETGKIYSKKEYYHSSIRKGKFIKAAFPDNTGMFHLDFSSQKEADNYKSKFKGYELYLEEAHFYGELKVYRAYLPDFSEDEYFSEDELEVGDIIINNSE
jgi:hypothetical protein